jgi:hypothetical protein
MYTAYFQVKKKKSLHYSHTISTSFTHSSEYISVISVNKTNQFMFKMEMPYPWGTNRITEQYFDELRFVSPCIIIHSNKTTNNASISQIYCSSFKYSSTCFEHLRARHQKLINFSSCLWFTVGTWWSQCRWSWCQTDHNQRHCYQHVPTVNHRRLLQFISSWWRTRRCPKHVELYLNYEQ